MSRPIYFQGSAADAIRAVNRVVDILTGKIAAPVPAIPNGVYGAIGLQALSDIKADYVRKSGGGTGEDGVKWKPLSPVTIAKRRLQGNNALSKGEERKRLKQRLELALYARLSASLPPADAIKEAKRQASEIIKAKDQKRINILLKEEKVKILRDTGVLLNSLSPGVMRGQSGYAKPRGDGGDDQVFYFMRAGVIVGTNVPYAGVHQYGSEKQNIPARPFLPPPDATPQIWLDRWAAIGETAVAEAVTLHLEGRI
jgi:hypothetical protein